MISVVLPERPDQIPAALVTLQAQLAALCAQADVLRGAIKAIQKMCPHNTRTTGRDYDGGGWSRCVMCGDSW